MESQKTRDKINCFKSNDIKQMILVHPNKEEFLEDLPEFKKIVRKGVQNIPKIN